METPKLNDSPKHEILSGVPEGQDAFVLRERAMDAQRNGGAVACHIAMDDIRAQTVQDLLSFFAPEIEVILFPCLGLFCPMTVYRPTRLLLVNG